MKTLWFVAVAACIAGANACYAQEAVDRAKAATFDNRMFAGPLGQNMPASCGAMTPAIWRSIRSRKSAP